MAKTKKPAGTKGIMDVTHPDTAAPSGNSKSVIVSNRPLLQDPMVVAEEDKKTPSETSPEKETSATDSPPEIRPPNNDSKIVKPDSDDASPSSPADEPDTGEGDKDTKPEAAPETAADKSPAKNDKIPPKPDAEAEEQAKHQAAIDKLADGKKYYLPIDTIEKKRSQRFVALGVLFSLLLILAWADIALDAGLIQLGSIKPVTHFFSN